MQWNVEMCDSSIAFKYFAESESGVLKLVIVVSNKRKVIVGQQNPTLVPLCTMSQLGPKSLFNCSIFSNFACIIRQVRENLISSFFFLVTIIIASENRPIYSSLVHRS